MLNKYKKGVYLKVIDKIMYNTRKWKKVKIAFSIVLFFLCFYWGLHAGKEFNTNPLCDNAIASLVHGFVSLIKTPILTGTILINVNTLLSLGCAIFVYGIIMLLLIIDAQRHKHYDPKTACGAAQWNEDLDEYNKRYSDPPGSPNHDGPNNMILTNDVFLNLDGRITQRNNNVCVVGGSGSGKSRYFVKPNLLMANSNFIVTDPSGDLLKATGKFLHDKGYEIKIFNLVEMRKSDCYNPFDYIRDDLGVVMMIRCLIKNTTPPDQKGGEAFWVKSEEALLQALCFYLVNHCEKKDRHFTKVMELLRLAEVDERNPGHRSPLDKLFEDVEAKDPNSIAVKQYKTFKMGAGKTLKSILISCSVRLTVFNIPQIENLTGRDTIGLDKMGEGKKALFVIIPSADSTYNFLVSMMYSQLFETLYYIAETQYKGNRLKSRVRFLLDEFANIGEIPEFTKKLATMRKYDMSCSVILQNLAQIKTMYKDDWQTILGNCDSFLFLGGQEYETLEYISKELGETTIIVKDRGMSNGKSSNASQNYKTTSRKLMNPEELNVFKDENGKPSNGEDCVLMIRGLNPFKGKKYEYTKHPNYKYTGDASDDNLYENKKDNSVAVTTEVIDMKEEREKAQQYAKAEQKPTPSTMIVGKPQTPKNFMQSAGIRNPEDAKEQYVVHEVAPPIPATEETNTRDLIDELASVTEVKYDEIAGAVMDEMQESAGISEYLKLELRENTAGKVEENDQKSSESEIKEINISPKADDKVETESDSEQTGKEELPVEQQVQSPSQDAEEKNNNSIQESADQKRKYPYRPTEKTLMKKDKINPGTPTILSNSDKEAEIWDFG